MMYSRLREMLILHEGVRHHVYDDATGRTLTPGTVLRGFPTVGVGRNLATRGLSRDEIEYLLNNDIRAVRDEVRARLHDIWPLLNDARKDAICDMAFNLGVAGLLQFRRMLSALRRQDWDGAAREMLDSLWAQQVGERARRLAAMMRSGTYEALDDAF